MNSKKSSFSSNSSSSKLSSTTSKAITTSKPTLRTRGLIWMTLFINWKLEPHLMNSFLSTNLSMTWISSSTETFQAGTVTFCFHPNLQARKKLAKEPVQKTWKSRKKDLWWKKFPANTLQKRSLRTRNKNKIKTSLQQIQERKSKKYFPKISWKTQNLKKSEPAKTKSRWLKIKSLESIMTMS